MLGRAGIKHAAAHVFRARAHACSCALPLSICVQPAQLQSCKQESEAIMNEDQVKKLSEGMEVLNSILRQHGGAAVRGSAVGDGTAGPSFAAAVPERGNITIK